MFTYSVLMQKNFEVMKILYIIINALGASFYDINPSKFKYFATLYSLLIFSLYVSQIFLSIILFPNWERSAPLAAFCVFKFCEMIVPIFVIVQSFYTGRAYLKSCIDDIIFTDKLLHITGIEVGYAKMQRTVKQTFINTTLYVSFILGSSYLFFIRFSDKFSVVETVAVYILETSNVAYNIYLNYFFCLVLIIFKQRFETLNEQIRCIAGPKLVEGVSVITVKPYNLECLYLDKIKTVKFAHSIYRQIMLDHNNRFGFVILLQFIQIGTVLILCIYYLLFMLINIEDLKDPVLISVVVVTIIRCSTLILSTIVCCGITSSEANQIENVVHELMSETDDREVIQELENFSVELIHAKVKFTAYGFFTIDFCLLTKLVGSIVSYVIIFLQLGGSSSNYDGIFDLKVNKTTSLSD